MCGQTLRDSPTHNGKPVTAIGKNAFSSESFIKSIVIPDSVTSIDYYAFNGWKSFQIIFCEAVSKPSGWDSDWNRDCSAKICWGDEWEYIDGVPALK